DATTGLYNIGAREYDPALGRFISLDPIMDLTDPQQIHGYTYANNNPLAFTDPTGLFFKEIAKSIKKTVRTVRKAAQNIVRSVGVRGVGKPPVRSAQQNRGSTATNSSWGNSVSTVSASWGGLSNSPTGPLAGMRDPLYPLNEYLRSYPAGIATEAWNFLGPDVDSWKECSANIGFTTACGSA
ncbi:RHS repeat-associated core domain-containing protein, partial [Streptomyces otsuchiensis]|uniref:RHS repeat-associated core domain-containing protein n=1 Tax=Streptomyces otsuchiensis TaxID=2681388 RepID=UPI0010305711